MTGKKRKLAKPKKASADVSRRTAEREKAGFTKVLEANDEIAPSGESLAPGQTFKYERMPGGRLEPVRVRTKLF